MGQGLHDSLPGHQSAALDVVPAATEPALSLALALGHVSSLLLSFVCSSPCAQCSHPGPIVLGTPSPRSHHCITMLPLLVTPVDCHPCQGYLGSSCYVAGPLLASWPVESSPRALLLMPLRHLSGSKPRGRVPVEDCSCRPDLVPQLTPWELELRWSLRRSDTHWAQTTRASSSRGSRPLSWVPAAKAPVRAAW